MATSSTSRKAALLLTAAWPLPDDDPIIYAYNVARGGNGHATTSPSSPKSRGGGSRIGNKYRLSYGEGSYEGIDGTATAATTTTTSKGSRRKQPAQLTGKGGVMHESAIQREHDDDDADCRSDSDAEDHHRRAPAGSSSPLPPPTRQHDASSGGVGGAVSPSNTRRQKKVEGEKGTTANTTTKSSNTNNSMNATMNTTIGAASAISTATTTTVRERMARDRDQAYLDDLKKVRPFVKALHGEDAYAKEIESVERSLRQYERQQQQHLMGSGGGKQSKRKGKKKTTKANTGTASPSPAPSAESQRPQWSATNVPEPVFAYDGLHDPNLQGYYVRSQNARKALVGHGVITTEGEPVNMHHVGGQIWLNEKRHQISERRKQIAEERLRTEQMHERQRQLEALADIARSGKVNRLRVASHIAYSRKREARNKERETAMREKLSKQQARREALEQRSHPSNNYNTTSGNVGQQQQLNTSYDSDGNSMGGVHRTVSGASQRSVVSASRRRSSLRRGSSVSRHHRGNRGGSPSPPPPPPMDWGLLAMADPLHTIATVTVKKRETAKRNKKSPAEKKARASEEDVDGSPLSSYQQHGHYQSHERERGRETDWSEGASSPQEEEEDVLQPPTTIVGGGVAATASPTTAALEAMAVDEEHHHEQDLDRDDDRRSVSNTVADAAPDVE